MSHRAEAYKRLFPFLEEAVLSSGGDGDAWVVSSDFRELAEMFKSDWFKERHDKGDSIYFNNEQESICFTNKLEGIPRWAELVIKWL